MHAVGTRHVACFVEQYGKRISTLLDILLAFEQAVDLLRRNEDDGCASFTEFIISRLKLSHLAGAVWSPRAANKNDDKRFAPKFEQSNDGAIRRGECKIRSGVAGVKGIRVGSKHAVTVSQL